jgi:hypothetical protein
MSMRMRGIAVLASVALMPLFGATSAHAAGAIGNVDTSCPSNGYITSGDVCTKLTNGTLYLHETSNENYIDIEYGKSGGSTVACTLGYQRNGKNIWAAATTCSTSYQQNHQWSVAASCLPDVGLLLSSGTTYQTPPSKSC